MVKRGPRKGLMKIPGLAPLYKFLYLHLRPQHIFLAEVQGQKMWVDPKDTVMSQSLIMSGRHDAEKYETELFKSVVKKGDIVVDIGANIGYYTLIAAKLVGEEGKVYAFEPEPYNFGLLLRNIETNGYKNIIPVQKGISNKRGMSKLFLSPENLGAHTLYNLDQERKFVEVETITIDEYFESEEKIDVVKIDVEGAEEIVLDGMQKIIKKNNLKIFIEPKKCGKEPFFTVSSSEHL